MTSLSKEEYLKRYLSGGASDDVTKEKKKKKKEKKDKKKKGVGVLQPRMRIIDNDADVPAAYEASEKKKTKIIYNDVDDDDDEEEPDNVEEMPTIAMVEDSRPEEIKVFEEFKKSGKWKTFDGEDLTAKHIVHEVIKLEPDVKTEPLDSEEEEMLRRLGSKKKKSKKRRERERVGGEVKEEPLSPVQDRLGHVQVKQEEASSDNSPPRRQRHDSDNSPPRRQRHDSDNSPPRRQRHDSDNSPPRREARCDSDGDLSPPRRRNDSSGGAADSDISPPRRKRAGGGGDDDSDQSPPRKKTAAGADSSQRMKTTLDGKKAGLQRAVDLKDELAEIRAKERRLLDGLDTAVSGRFAETKVRGRLKEAEEKKRQERERKEVPEEVKQKFEVLNKGVAQVRGAQARLEDNLYEMSKPLTRTENDTDREDLLKQQEREEDPMLAYMRKKKEQSVRSAAGGKVKKMPVYQGPAPPPNRFGIRPGYRWDGVVRTNGFEQKLLTRGSEQKARDEEAYKWSIEEM